MNKLDKIDKTTKANKMNKISKDYVSVLDPFSPFDVKNISDSFFGKYNDLVKHVARLEKEINHEQTRSSRK